MENIESTAPPKQQSNIAVVIHAYYFDTFLEILSYFSSVSVTDFVFYVSTTEKLYKEVDESLKKSGFKYTLLAVQNKGRDVLPFLKFLPLVYDRQHSLILKLHTKKSKHLLNGNDWAKPLYNALIGNDVLLENIQRFDAEPKLDIWAPLGYMASMKQNWHPNKKKILTIARTMSIDERTIKSLYFPAGTMFFARTMALIPLLTFISDVQDECFEEELGQLDGTMAHAVERAVSLSIIKAGFMLPTSNLKSNTVFGKHLSSGGSVRQKIINSYRIGGALQVLRDLFHKFRKRFWH